MSKKDVELYITKPDNPHGDLIIRSASRPNSKFFKLTDTVADIINWINEYADDYPEMNPHYSPKDDEAWAAGSKAAELAITKNETHKNPYDRRINYAQWNSWALGHYYGMK